MTKVYQDLRSFLDTLEEEGQLLHVTDEVLPEPGVSSACRAAARMQNGPAVMFDNIAGYPEGTRIVTNVHGSWANHALMMGMDKNTPTKEQFFELNRRWDTYPVEPKILSRDEAPCKENTLDAASGDEIDLFHLLPLYRINDQDAGCYFSKFALVSADPDDPDNFNKMNVGTYRIQVKDKETLGIQVIPSHDMAVHLKKCEARNEPLHIAIALGNAPLVTFMASTPIGHEQNESEFVGALNDGVPAEIVRADTDEHLFVPAGSEVILEGYIEPRVRKIEGPFGEFTGSVSGARRQLEAKITHVTYRTNPIFESLYIGMPWTECDYLVALNTSVPLFKQIQKDMPEVVAVNAMYTHGMTEIISMKPRYGGQAATAAFRIMSTPHGAQYAHNVIIVDDFVDPFDLNQVMWALSTRVRPDKDVKVIPNCPGMTLNPTEEIPGITAKLVIDATTPIDPEPVTREVEMLGDPAETADYAKLLAELWAAKNK